ncbi:MAG: TIGR02679 family protein [Pseudonocardiaceae bacterium]
MSLPGWLADPALSRIWAVLRDRLEARGLRAHGQVRLTELTRGERHAVSALIGRPVTTSTVAVNLAALDERLTARSPLGGLLPVVEAATGSPLQDRPAHRAHRAADRDAPFAAALVAVGGDPVLAGRPWVPGWLDGVRRCGLLGRVRDPVTVMTVAVRVLSELLAAEVVPGRARKELAATAAGGAHELDDGSPIAQVVLRALAAQAGEPLPASAVARRGLWERFGVLADAVSTTCLTLGLRSTGAAATAQRLILAADAGDPLHLTPWDLRHTDLRMPTETSVLVCENPHVLEAVAQTHGGRVPVVCTAGQPALVVLDVLQRLADDGAVLRYHGDFDWPGISITNRLVAELGVQPWLMNAEHYTAALGDGFPRVPLTGNPVDPVWDAELGAAMRHHGVAVHEEAVLHDLLTALTPPGCAPPEPIKKIF